MSNTVIAHRNPPPIIDTTFASFPNEGRPLSLQALSGEEIITEIIDKAIVISRTCDDQDKSGADLFRARALGNGFLTNASLTELLEFGLTCASIPRLAPFCKTVLEDPKLDRNEARLANNALELYADHWYPVLKGSVSTAIPVPSHVEALNFIKSIASKPLELDRFSPSELVSQIVKTAYALSDIKDHNHSRDLISAEVAERVNTHLLKLMEFGAGYKLGEITPAGNSLDEAAIKWAKSLLYKWNAAKRFCTAVLSMSADAPQGSRHDECRHDALIYYTNSGFQLLKNAGLEEIPLPRNRNAIPHGPKHPAKDNGKPNGATTDPAATLTA